MEHFDNNPRSVKEKSVYLLHLDTPRIIILASVIIGLILLSFLVGMNFIKGDKNSDIIAGNDTLFSSEKSIHAGDKKIPAPPDGSSDNLFTEEKIVNTDSGEKATGLKTESGDSKNVSGDILTSDSIKEILPPSEKQAEIKKPVKTAKIKKREVKISRKRSHSSNKRRSAKSRKGRNRNSVMAVSRKHREKAGKSPHYSIQVASFDRRGKADREVRSLREMKYDAHVKSTFVKGKKYYRVKIGPLFSKKKAVKLLNDIQGSFRYRNSYMIKE